MSRKAALWLIPFLALGAAAVPGQTIPPPTQPTPAAQAPRHLTFHFGNRYLFDSNINHSSDDPKETRGAVFGLMALYRNPADKPSVEISYEIARHFHTAEEWDRMSHNLRASWEKRASKALIFETVGEMSLKGSTEDRDISDTYSFSPRLEYRLTREHRLRGYGAYRIRRFPEDHARDARNRYLGAEYALRSQYAGRLDVGFRYEINRADDPRHHYTRWSYYTQYAIPLDSRNRVETEVWYRPRRYDVRRVEVGEAEVLRRDKNWIFAGALIHTFGAKIDVGLEYRYETRTSNDEDKGFNEHTIATAIGYHF